MTNRSRHGLFAAFTVALLALHASAVRNVITLSHDGTASHLILIPFMTLALLYARRGSLFAEDVRGMSGAGWRLGGLLALSWIASAYAPAAGPVYVLTVVVSAMVAPGSPASRPATERRRFVPLFFHFCFPGSPFRFHPGSSMPLCCC
jgi:hypothetical protein